MNASLRLWPCKGGKLSPICLDALFRAFSELKVDKRSGKDEYRVSDEEGQTLCTLSVGTASDLKGEVSFVEVRHPVKSLVLWEAIHRCMSSNEIILVWSVSSHIFAVVGSEDALEHVPDSLVSQVRSTEVATSGEDLLSIVTSL